MNDNPYDAYRDTILDMIRQREGTTVDPLFMPANDDDRCAVDSLLLDMGIPWTR